MKLALIFLMRSTLVVISSQQFQQSPVLSQVFWWLPQYVQHNNDQPLNYRDRNNLPSIRQIIPIRPDIYSQNGGIYAPGLPEGLPEGTENQNDMIGEVHDFSEGRNKGFTYYQPSPPSPYPRFFFNNNNNLNNLGAGTGYRPLLRTATFTFTSTLSLTSVQSCIPIGEFVAGKEKTPCRRKREITSSDAESEKNQFSIAPSQMLRVIPTESFSLERTIPHQLPVINHQSVDHGVILSSKDESVVNAEMSELLTRPDDQFLRERRFFINRFGAITTVTSYFLASKTITQTVILVDPAAAEQMVLNCLPAGYIVCP